MKIKRLRIENFKAIEHIEVFFQDKITVIVGPNSVGKTTVLEAIRLCKGVLCPRTAQEAQEILQKLNVISPHQPNQLQLGPIARDVTKKIIIELDLELSDNEIVEIESAKNLAVNAILQSRLGQQFANPSTLANFLSTQFGQQNAVAVQAEVEEKLKSLKLQKLCKLVLTIENSSVPLKGNDPVLQILIGLLEQQLSPSKTKFSYFPADRALPPGEFAVQLGMADVLQQMEAHNSQPVLKFQRFKNVIFNSIIAGEEERQKVAENLKFIFSNLIKELTFVGAGVSPIGSLFLNVQDAHGRVFQIDALSSGEKTILMTFLTIAQTLTPGGVVLLDEPEQHLNPAVCKDIIPFVLNNYASAQRDIQFIICSHSPEVLAGAYGSDGCALWRIKTYKHSTEVRVQDRDEVEQALRHLGTSQTESLIYKGIIFVEGDDDIALLESGFDALLKRHKLIEMGGRPELEKTILRIQSRECPNDDDTLRTFIFDRDNRHVNLRDSNTVRIKQLDRYCIENYLIDLDVLGDALLNPDYCRPLSDISVAKARIKELAFSQIDRRALLNTIKALVPKIEENSLKNFTSGAIRQVAEKILHQIASLYSDVLNKNPATWLDEFSEYYSSERSDLEQSWTTKWQIECDGKQLFEDIYSGMQPRIKKRKFKKEVMRDVKDKETVGYRELRNIIQSSVAEVD